MEAFSFSINGVGTDHLSVRFEEVYGFPGRTSHWGGFDARTALSIKSGAFSAKGELWTSTGEIYLFARSLKEAFEALRGSVFWETYERNLRVKIEFRERGTIVVGGTYREYYSEENAITFSFAMDQTYLIPTLKELDRITSYYGNQKGVVEAGG